jgi:hypothetical protein
VDEWATDGEDTTLEPKPDSLNVTVPLVAVTAVAGVTVNVRTVFTAPGLKSLVVAVNAVMTPMPISPVVPDTALGAKVVDTLTEYEPDVAVF